MKRFYVTVWTPTHGGGFHEGEYRNAETGEGPYTYGTSLAGVAIALENRGIPVCKIQEVERNEPHNPGPGAPEVSILIENYLRRHHAIPTRKNMAGCLEAD